MGVYRYAAHQSTEVTCCAYAVDDGPVKLWLPNDPVPKEFWHAAKEDWIVVAHNNQFEHVIEQKILSKHNFFPTFKLENSRCTMARSYQLALPGSLEDVAAVCKLKNQKDVVGARLVVNQMCKPRRARKDEDPTKVHWYEDEERKQRQYDYCMQDTAAERELFYAIGALPDSEQKLWELDQRINARGFYLDQDLARAAVKIAEDAKPIINQELEEITGGAVSAFTQVARILAWINQQGVGLFTTLDKNLLAEKIKLETLPSEIQRVLELRLLGAQAAAGKAQALLDRVEPDGRVRGAFIYHAAGTGRWSSRGAQIHNLKKPKTKDLEEAIKVIGTGSYTKAKAKYDNPMAVIGDLIRSMIIAPPKHVLMGADFSGIEARVTAWIADEEAKLEVFRKYDRTGDPLDDPYVIAASKVYRISPEEVLKDKFNRDVGKACELAFGFQGGVNAFRRFEPSGAVAQTPPKSEVDRAFKVGAKKVGRSAGYDGVVTKAVAAIGAQFTDAQIDEIKKKWRRAHPNIVRFWDALNRAAIYAVKHPGEVVRCGRLQLHSDDAPFLYITLPSGRAIAYPNARIAGDQYRSGDGVVFMDNTSGRWEETRGYGGFFTENIVQGIARDLLAEAMVRIDRTGFAIVTHTHDECVIEVSKHTHPGEFQKLMTTNPPWAQGLPLVAKVWTSPRYLK